ERVAIGPVAEESVATLRETAGPSLDLVCALVALGQARLLAGDLQGGAGVLAEATAVARAVRPRYWITYALYWQGYVAQARGDLAAALAALDEGVALALEEGYHAPIAHLATLRGRLALAEGDTEGALASLALGLTRLKVTQNHWSTIILMEDLARIAAARGDAGRAARAPGAWSSAESRELLLYLLCHPAGCTREQIGQALWRDASPAQIKSNLHVTLHELRRTLGRPDWIVFEEERYRLNSRFAVQFDARQFEAEVRAARVALAKAGDPAPLERALERYRGDFLGDRDS